MTARLRVIAGTAGSVPLDGPARNARPTTDRTRETLFSSLGEVVEGRPFVDLYAGSGAVGIEALSRGAARCLFVERAAENVRVIRANLLKTGLAERAEIWGRGVEAAVERLAEWLDGERAVIFADPPYEDRQALAVWAKVLAGGVAVEGSVLVLEHSCRTARSGLAEPTKQRRAGETCLSFWGE